MIRHNKLTFSLTSVTKAISTRRKNLLLTVLMLFSSVIASMLMPPCIQAASITLAWDANNPSPDGYRLFRRFENQSYDYYHPVWQGTATSCSLNDLQDGATYYFVVRAYVGGQESGDSNELRIEAGGTLPNQPPTADAGANQTVASQRQVVLNGSQSSDPENQVLTYSWSQTAGVGVTLSNSQVAQPRFSAPLVQQNTTLAFELMVRDPLGLSSTDTCLVMITPPSPENEDSDGDGYLNAEDAFPNDPSEWLDTDHDGIGNNADTDDDNDQMTDSWEIQYGLNPLVNDASQDLDGDGVSNLDEFNQGTDPTIPNDNNAPLTPAIIFPVDGQSQVSMHPRFVAGPFEDPDAGDSHGATQWRIFRTDNDALVLDRRVTRHNLESLRIPRLILQPSTTYRCEVRYFDSHDAASPWSDPVIYSTMESKEDKDKNGVPDNQDVSSSTDLNKDGIADIEQGSAVKSAQFDNENQVAISILNASNALAIESLELIAPEDLEDSPYPAQEMPFGLVGFVIKLDAPGQQADLEFYSSKQISGDASQWIRYDEVDGWEVIENDATMNVANGVVKYRIKDGDEADADGAANGVIINLSGPRLVDPEGDGTSLENGDNGSSGSSDKSAACFIHALHR